MSRRSNQSTRSRRSSATRAQTANTAAPASRAAPNLEARAQTLAAEMRALRLAAVQAKFQEVFGHATRAKDRAGLIAKIAAELAHRAVAGTPPPDAASQPASAASGEPRRRGRRGRFTGMCIDELQALYAEQIGRPTSSTDRRYLEWKLREAAKGRVTVGPIERGSGIGEGGEMMTLPWRIPRALVEAMDEGWRALHFKTRSAFLAAAVGSLFASKGEHALARRFGVQASDAA